MVTESPAGDSRGDRYAEPETPQTVESPSQLWAKADREYPGDAESRRMRYFELMVKAGHLIVKPPPVEQYTADNPPSHINRHRNEG